MSTFKAYIRIRSEETELIVYSAHRSSHERDCVSCSRKPHLHSDSLQGETWLVGKQNDDISTDLRREKTPIWILYLVLSLYVHIVNTRPAEEKKISWSGERWEVVISYRIVIICYAELNMISAPLRLSELGSPLTVVVAVASSPFDLRLTGFDRIRHVKTNGVANT